MNCESIFELGIPKGVTIQNYFNNSNAKCKVCGCTTLSKYSNEPDLKKILDDYKGGIRDGKKDRRR